MTTWTTLGKNYRSNLLAAAAMPAFPIFSATNERPTKRLIITWGHRRWMMMVELELEVVASFCECLSLSHSLSSLSLLASRLPLQKQVE